MSSNQLCWIRRVLVLGIALTFWGHGFLAFSQKAQWLNYLHTVSIPAAWHGWVMKSIGLLDMILALVVLVKPYRAVLAWMTFWAFATALIRPLSGESWLEFVERGANWTAPLALYLLENRRK